MPIDAQSIASIGQNTGDIAGSTMKAYTLADAIDRRQMNQMTLQSQREEQADLGKIKTLSQQYDLSNPEQRHELASRVQKEVGGKYAMDFMRMADEQDRRSQELSASQLDTYQKKHEIMTSAIMPMYQQIQAATQQGMPPGQIEAQLLPAFKQTLETLQKQTLPNGEKVLNQQDIQQISTMLSGQPGALLGGINSAMASSRTAQEFFAKQRKEQSENIIEKNIKGPDNKTHTYTFNKLTGQRLQDLGIAESPERPQTINVNTPTGEESRNVAQMIAKYEIPAPSARSPGFAKMMAMVKELNPTYNAARYDATKAEAVKVGQREAATASAIEALNEKDGLYDQLLETSKKVDFGSSLWKNQFELFKAGNVVSDPAIRDYLNALADTRAEFGAVLARGGQTTDAVRSATEHAFPEKMSAQELQVAVDRSKKVADAIRRGNENVLNRLLNGESLGTVAKAAEKTSTPAVTKPPTESPPLGTPRDGGGGPKQPPAIGTIVKGHRFKGGDPSQESSWEKVGG
jgi:hypothetical protein